MPRPIHFEIQADDTARAITFYRALFGWEFSQWGTEKYWLVKTGADATPGINGGLLPRPCPGPAEGTSGNAFVCTMDVDNVDAYVERLVELGGRIALPKMPIPTMGWLAYGHDTEGNTFGLMQMDPNAK